MNQSPNRPPIINTLRQIRQTRAFTQQAVPDAALNDILEVARWTGSAGNVHYNEFGQTSR